MKGYCNQKNYYHIMRYILLLSFIFFFLSFVPPTKQRVFLIGDSTMANKKATDTPETGWAQVWHEYFNQGIELHNHAVNGRSTKSFRSLGHWKQVMEQIQKDDYLIIQFGHNDSKIDDTLRYAPAKTIYRENLIRYIDEAKSKGAIPILATPIYRRKFDDNGKLMDTHGDYPQVVRDVAREKGVELLDLHARSADFIAQQGEELSKYMFMNFGKNIYPKFPEGLEDNTHFSPYGAHCIAALAAKELVAIRHPLRNFLKKSVYPNKFEYELPNVIPAIFPNDTFNIVRYGAVSSANSINTNAIQSAIDNAATLGGGTVLVPKGFWVTGPIELKSNINLHIAEGAFLQFSDNRNIYPLVKTTWEGQEAYRCQAPISARNCSNIALTGKGNIDGAGQVWKSIKRNKLTDAQWKRLIASGGIVEDDTWYPSEVSKIGSKTDWAKKMTEGKTIQDYETVRDFLRPNMISFIDCNVVLIEGVTITNSPAWTIHPLLCQHTSVRNVNVKNPWFGQNNDAIDLESCRNGILEGCNFDTGDDAITIKSGRDAEGRKRGIPTENWIVRNMKVMHGHGGFVIGSEMSGGVNNMFVNNCIFVGTDIGLRFKTTRGRGGMVKDIFISDVQMAEIVGEAILFDMYYAAKDPIKLSKSDEVNYDFEMKPFTDETPIFKDFYLENIYCRGADAALKIDGLPESNLQNVTLTNANISAQKGILIGFANNITLKNVEIKHQSGQLIQINNAQNIVFDNFTHYLNNEKLGAINGKNTNNILFQKSKNVTSEQFELGSNLEKRVLKVK
jgi:DNA sulfur modification protein DndE